MKYEFAIFPEQITLKLFEQLLESSTLKQFIESEVLWEAIINSQFLHPSQKNEFEHFVKSTEW